MPFVSLPPTTPQKAGGDDGFRMLVEDLSL